MRSYEMMTVLRPDLGGEDEFNAYVETVQGFVTSQGGTITSVDHSSPWGRRKLAYPIKDKQTNPAVYFTEGYYILTHFEIETQGLNELERSLKLADPVLRYLLVQEKKKKNS